MNNIKEGDTVELYGLEGDYTVTYIDLKNKKFGVRQKEWWSYVEGCDFSDVESHKTKGT